jgi:hypothetical protein
MTDWLTISCFASRSRIFHLYGDVTITGEGLQNLGIWLAIRPLSREGYLSCRVCWYTKPRFSGLVRRRPPHLVVSYDTHRDVKDLFLHEEYYSHLATVSIYGDRAANLDLCLALVAFSSQGSFTCHTYCDTGPPFLRSYPKKPWLSLLHVMLLAKKQ